MHEAYILELAVAGNAHINKLMEELSTQAIAAFDVETRFRTLAASGDAAQTLAILNRLDVDRASSRTQKSPPVSGWAKSLR